MELVSRPGPPQSGGGEKPLPRDMSHHFSQTTKNRMPSKIKQYYKFFQIPNVGNCAGGLPHVSLFPFDTLEAQTAKPERFVPTPNDPNTSATSSRSSSSPGTSDHGRHNNTASAHITVPKTTGEPDPLKKIDLETGLQYGTSQGYPPLLSWVRQFTRDHLHDDIPYRGGAECVLTVGSTDGFSKTIELLVDPWVEGRDDPRKRPGLLCERFAYNSALAQAAVKGVQAVPVQTDRGGMRVDGPGGLEDVLANWDESKGLRPRLMYTVTMGHNPTGIVLSVERRKAIYALCSKYDVIIVEDDPYWYMQFPSADAEEAKSRSRPAPAPRPKYRRVKPSGYPFLDSMVPSFLCFDTDGRVIRLDTFSKTVAPGCRLGWITAQPAIIERFILITDTTTQQPSGFAQSVISELVMGAQPPEVAASWLSLRTPRDRAAFAGWRTDGWVRWLEGLRGEYERRMARVCRILDAGAHQIKQGTPVARRVAGDSVLDEDWGVITKRPLYEYDWPRGGMFVWLRVLYEAHPLWRATRPGRTGEPAGVLDGPALSGALLIMLTRKPYLVLVAPGAMFGADEKVDEEDAWAYFRICFAAVADDMLEPLMHRFVEGVQRFFTIKRVQEIEDLLSSAPVAAAAVQDLADVDDQERIGDMGMYMGC